MCMNKNDLINEIVASLTATMGQEQADIVKTIFIVKMHGYDIYEVNTLPSVEVIDNDYILKRFTIDMLAKGLKKSSIKTYMNTMKPFLRDTGLCYLDVTAQTIIDYLAIKKIEQNKNRKQNSQSYVAGISRVLFVFFQWAYRKRHIKEDIMRDVDRIRAKQKKKDRITA